MTPVRGNKKIQVVYSSMNTIMLSFVDTSVVVQVFKDTLILKEIHYNLEDEYSSKWSHHIN